jgi:magnesium-transporting ATPase (P-type)
MELAVLLAAGLRDWIDLGVICGILLLNALVGWYQEKQAADVVDRFVSIITQNLPYRIGPRK